MSRGTIFKLVLSINTFNVANCTMQYLLQKCVAEYSFKVQPCLTCWALQLYV